VVESQLAAAGLFLNLSDRFGGLEHSRVFVHLPGNMSREPPVVGKAMQPARPGAQQQYHTSENCANSASQGEPGIRFGHAGAGMATSGKILDIKHGDRTRHNRKEWDQSKTESAE